MRNELNQKKSLSQVSICRNSPKCGFLSVWWISPYTFRRFSKIFQVKMGEIKLRDTVWSYKPDIQHKQQHLDVEFTEPTACIPRQSNMSVLIRMYKGQKVHKVRTLNLLYIHLILTFHSLRPGNVALKCTQISSTLNFQLFKSASDIFRLRHPHILQLYGFSTATNMPSIIFHGGK